MEQILPVEFPFVEELPKREKSRWAKVRDAWENFKSISDQHGGVVPVQIAAELGGVSHQRILQLLESGSLVRVELKGHVYVGENSFIEWAKSERKTGRPLKLPETVCEKWQMAKRVAKEICK